jgi:group I intron endonuclease
MIRNKINGKAYVGQTIQSLEDRLRHHLSPSSGCKAIKSAISKYGIENFEIQELAKVENISELNTMEIKYINELNTIAPNGYNLKSGGSRPTYSEDARKRMSEAQKRNPRKYTKKELKARSIRFSGKGNPNYGKKFSKEHLENMSKSHKGLLAGSKHPMYGKTHSEEARIKISQSKLGKAPWNKGKQADSSAIQKMILAKTKKYIIKENNKIHIILGLRQVSLFTEIPFGTLCGRIPKIGLKRFGKYLIGLN